MYTQNTVVLLTPSEITAYIPIWLLKLFVLNLIGVSNTSSVILWADNQEMAQQSCKHACFFCITRPESVRLRLASQRDVESLIQMYDKHLLHVHCQFMQLKRQTIQTLPLLLLFLLLLLASGFPNENGKQENNFPSSLLLVIVLSALSSFSRGDQVGFHG